MSTADFPKRLPEKLKLIRERLAMTPDQLAPFVGARNGAQILAYENDEDDLLVSCVMQLGETFRQSDDDDIPRRTLDAWLAEQDRTNGKS